MDNKLVKQISETKYLAVENTHRYRIIMRVFYLNYEKLKYWLYQEEIYNEVLEYNILENYTLEQCQQDLAALIEWKNLSALQDTRNASTIEEFMNKQYRYQMSVYSVEIERLVIKLENLSIEGTSLEATLLEKIKIKIEQLSEMVLFSPEKVYTWWKDLNDDFIKLNQNYQDYMRDLNNMKAEEMMKTKEFLVFKDKIIEYLRIFVKSLQVNTGIIEGYISEIKTENLEVIFEKVMEYEESIPRINIDFDRELLEDRIRGRWQSISDWFNSESSKVFDATNDIIRKITRYATQISEMNSIGANRKEEYAKLAQMFINTKNINEAHKLSAMVFGVETVIHLKGDFNRKTDSYNGAVFDEEPESIKIIPRVRSYREKSLRDPIKNNEEEKSKIVQDTIQEIEINEKLIRELIKDGKIDMKSLPVLKPSIRGILLDWISSAMEEEVFASKTENGDNYYINIIDNTKFYEVECEDGVFFMPHMEIIFGIKE